jgi:hypothetical protein
LITDFSYAAWIRGSLTNEFILLMIRYNTFKYIVHAIMSTFAFSVLWIIFNYVRLFPWGTVTDFKDFFEKFDILFAFSLR